MDYKDAGSLALAYWGSNIVGIVFMLVAYKWTRVARLMFFLLFGYASWINYTLANNTPEVYLDYADHALGFYAVFIRGWFSDNIQAFVSVIAIGQLLIAIGMLLNKGFVTAACIGAIIFLAAISPLGYYAAFPFSVTVSLACYFIVANDSKKFLWISETRRPGKRSHAGHPA